MTTIYDTIATMSNQEAFAYFNSLDIARLDDLEAQVIPLNEQMNAHSKVLADDQAKTDAQKTTNAWKRKGVPTLITRDSDAVLAARAAIEDIKPKLLALENQKRAIEKRIADYEKDLAESLELEIWSRNLATPITKRKQLPTPARIRRYEQYEAFELAESMAGPGWSRLTLDHRSSEGVKNRDAYYARIWQEDQVVVPQAEDKQNENQDICIQIDPPNVAPMTQVKKLPWWHAKYNSKQPILG